MKYVHRLTESEAKADPRSAEPDGSRRGSSARVGLMTGVLSVLLMSVGGCAMVGPDYVRPEAPLAAEWIAQEDDALTTDAGEIRDWWKLFSDPKLNALIEEAYTQNLSLEIAGARVIEAVARRGISVGNLYPQIQESNGTYARVENGKNRANQGGLERRTFDDWTVGFDAAWELDVWGRFRRGIEAADADLLASVASYDDVLVSLVAEVASNYLQFRIAQERLLAARANIVIQQRSLQITEAKFRNGMVTELDAAQANSLLRNTEAAVPAFEARLRQTQNSLSVLLGTPPRDLGDLLAGPPVIPSAPEKIALGLPADLLRRRPDVRQAERDLAAQSARIGIANSDFYPHLALVGSISLGADDFTDVFDAASFEGFGGPSFGWAILNYGRIRNNVRVQDAGFQRRVLVYESTVLRAQEEAENAIAAYLGTRRQIGLLDQSVASAKRAVHLVNIQYREGAIDYVRVLNAQQFLVDQQDLLASTRGQAMLSLVSLYKALGGGWELREGKPFLRTETVEQMNSRTNWGDLLHSPHVNEEATGAPGWQWPVW
ncbi:MAG: NodT family efflux transporter outer membrane factor (OMF) lipoprotein [Hyphomicrobiaceae bacterium]